MNLHSSAFEPSGSIPAKYTCDGMDISPPLNWAETPAGTRSLVLIADDPDAPRGTWVHWVAWNLSPELHSLPEGLPNRDSLSNGMKQGTTDFQKVGYGGPCPPSGVHRYFFKLYALDVVFDLPSGTSKKHLEKAMHGHILQHAELIGTYQRK